MPRPKKNVALRRKCAKTATEASVIAAKRRREEASRSDDAPPPPPQHDRCAKGERSWCFYNRSIALGQQPQSHTTMKVYFRLEEAQNWKIKGIYDRLTTDEMMTRCLQGITQNRNEHLHSRIWRICPKHRNASKMLVDFATATAVCNYNVGNNVKATWLTYLALSLHFLWRNICRTWTRRWTRHSDEK